MPEPWNQHSLLTGGGRYRKVAGTCLTGKQEMAGTYFSPRGEKSWLDIDRIILIRKYIIDIVFQYLFFMHFFQLLARQGSTNLA